MILVPAARLPTVRSVVVMCERAHASENQSLAHNHKGRLKAGFRCFPDEENKNKKWKTAASLRETSFESSLITTHSEHSSEDQPKVGGISSLIMFPSSVPREVEETGKRQRH